VAYIRRCRRHGANVGEGQIVKGPPLICAAGREQLNDVHSEPHQRTHNTSGRLCSESSPCGSKSCLSTSCHLYTHFRVKTSLQAPVVKARGQQLSQSPDRRQRGLEWADECGLKSLCHAIFAMGNLDRHTLHSGWWPFAFPLAWFMLHVDWFTCLPSYWLTEYGSMPTI
ncbi:unnamed protein product, partial [Protopolystoma xenopodis]